jgi:hypothetical protein
MTMWFEFFISVSAASVALVLAAVAMQRTE